MKNKSLRMATLALGILSIATALAFATIVRPGLRKKPHGYVIQPIKGVVSDQTWIAVKNKLAKWDKQLYLIQTYKNGAVVKKKTVGTMNEMFLDKPLSDWNQDAINNDRFTGCAIQIGIDIFQTDNAEPDETHTVDYPHSHLIQSIKDSEELVNDVAGLLDPAPPSPPGR
jgi:hypothetical protein